MHVGDGVIGVPIDSRSEEWLQIGKFFVWKDIAESRE